MREEGRDGMEDRTGRLLLERMRRLEERVERDAQRLRVDLRSRQEAAEAVMRTTREEVEGVRRDLAQSESTLTDHEERLRRLEGQGPAA